MYYTNVGVQPKQSHPFLRRSKWFKEGQCVYHLMDPISELLLFLIFQVLINKEFEVEPRKSKLIEGKANRII